MRGVQKCPKEGGGAGPPVGSASQLSNRIFPPFREITINEFVILMLILGIVGCTK